MTSSAFPAKESNLALAARLREKGVGGAKHGPTLLAAAEALANATNIINAIAEHLDRYDPSPSFSTATLEERVHQALHDRQAYIRDLNWQREVRERLADVLDPIRKGRGELPIYPRTDGRIIEAAIQQITHDPTYRLR